MKLIIRAGLFLAIISGITFPSSGEEPQQVVMCSGTTIKINATSYFANSLFLWQKMEEGKWTSMGATGSSADFTGSSSTEKSTDVRCIMTLGTIPYDTLFYRIKIMPVPVISKISANQLCLGKLSSFDYTTPTNVVNQKWSFNETDTLLQRSAMVLIKSAGDLRVNLKVSNSAGCSSTKDTTFRIAALPNVEIQRARLVHPEYYFEKVGCGNDSTLFTFSTLGTGVSISRWFITFNGTVIFEKTLPAGTPRIDQKYIKRANISGNSLTVIWNTLAETSEFVVGTDYSVNNGCAYTKSTSLIILPYKTPDKGIIYQKPNNSKVLIFKPVNKDADTTLNYEWGYTVNGEEMQVKNNRFFNQFNELNSNNKYWVETFFANSKECRSRTYFIPGTTKSVDAGTIALRLYPNPASQQVRIALEKDKSGSLFLLDVSGSVLKTCQILSQEEVTWNLNGIKPGNYVVVFEDRTGAVKTEKLSITY